MAGGELIPIALSLAAAGLSVVPIVAGTKGASIEWTPLQRLILEPDAIKYHWRNGNQIGVICGSVSGNLEVMDFDCPDKALPPPAWDDFKELIASHGMNTLAEKLLWIKTPSGGYHLAYRIGHKPAGNLKLAYDEYDRVMIETRGEGGYVVTAPSEGYEIKRGAWTNLPVLTDDEHEFLLCAARFLHIGKQDKVEHPRTSPSIQRPGDAYNLNGPSCAALLEEHGWKPCRGRSKGQGGNFYTRPGKEHGPSASVTYNGAICYVYTSNAHPLEAGKAYSRFSLYTALKFRGDFAMAARQLASEGFGASSVQRENIAVREQNVAEFELDLKPLSSYEVEIPNWLMEEWQYLRRGHLNLLEAKGYTGKSTLTLAIAIMGANGRTPFGDTCKPFRTLYIAKQDNPGEIRYRVQKIDPEAKNLDSIIPWDTCSELDIRGLDKLQRAIEKYDIGFVVYDPMKSLFPRTIRNDFDNVGLNKFFDDLRQVHITTNSAGLPIRHFPKVLMGRGLSELATGGSEWRDSARAQLVMLPHPDREGHKTYTGIFPARGSMNAGPGEPFGFVAFPGGGMRFDIPEAFPLDTFAEAHEFIAEHYGLSEFLPEKKNKGGRPADSARPCLDWLIDYLYENGQSTLAKLRSEADRHGWSAPVMYRAKEISRGEIIETDTRPKIWKLAGQ